VQPFEANDAGYLMWVNDHSDGFDVNTERPPSQRCLMLHRAACSQISRATQQGGWTRDYMKICASSIAELDQ
jgi:hypothetical protein